MSLLKKGSKAPSFSLLNQDGVKVQVEDFRGRYLVLYFYPKALTPGCTTQACSIRDVKRELNDAGAEVIGISPDSVVKLKKFCDKHQLNFDLLADEEHIVADTYGVWGLKKFMGKEFMGVIRTTFIIDPKGNIAEILDKFSTSSHHQTVLDWFAAKESG
ncbi:MAG TPA: thioredoxin-dependent thiol peroxidase [Cellvibrio sp.]|nr:thioredoxin-dependent thiol peroxidase [Cellvibrio sp.]